MTVAALCTSLLTDQSAFASPGGAGATPPLPTIGEYSPLHSRVVNDGRAMSPGKQKAWTARLRATNQGRRVALAAATTKSLAEPLYVQKTGYYCGPTTLAMVTTYLGVGWGGSQGTQQDSAANLLGTTSDGTAWYGSDNVPSFPKSSWYPMEDALNYRLYRVGKSTWYDHVSLPDTPTSAQQVDFRDHLTFDIDQGYPGEDNQYSIPGYQIGFQPSGTWYHWWSARGYANSGEITYFNDPASWSQGRMSSETTRGGKGTVVMALGARGYIW